MCLRRVLQRGYFSLGWFYRTLGGLEPSLAIEDKGGARLVGDFHLNRTMRMKYLSEIVNRLRQAKEVVLHGCTWKIGSTGHVQFWHDWWSEGFLSDNAMPFQMSIPIWKLFRFWQMTHASQFANPRLYSNKL